MGVLGRLANLTWLGIRYRMLRAGAASVSTIVSSERLLRTTYAHIYKNKGSETWY